MVQAVIEVGEKVHVITRRNFPDDVRRHFAGVVTAVSGGQMRVEGFAFVFNPISLEFTRKPEPRTRLFGILDNQLIILILPPWVAIDRLLYRRVQGQLVLTDGDRFVLDVNEFGGAS